MAGENYRGIWVYAEQQEGRLEPAVFEILAKARQLSAHSGEEVTAVLLGDKVEPRRQYISQHANFNREDRFEALGGGAGEGRESR